jgi:hypothetical protein
MLDNSIILGSMFFLHVLEPCSRLLLGKEKHPYDPSISLSFSSS